MILLIDIGGSGVKIAEYDGTNIKQVTNYGRLHSLDEFAGVIRKICKNKRLFSIAISAAGFVDADKGKVIKSRCARYLEGDLVLRLQNYFPGRQVFLMNDGEAHARALLHRSRNVRFGAIHVAIGTSLAFGVIDHTKTVLRSCSGENWDVGDFELRTREKPYEVWYKLGSAGLKELEEKMGADAYLHFGWRLGSFLRNMAVIFRPKTIGLSGGIMASHAPQIMQGIREEFKEPVFSEKIDFVVLNSPLTAMEGLTTLY